MPRCIHVQQVLVLRAVRSVELATCAAHFCQAPVNLGRAALIYRSVLPAGIDPLLNVLDRLESDRTPAKPQSPSRVNSNVRYKFSTVRSKDCGDRSAIGSYGQSMACENPTTLSSLRTSRSDSRRICSAHVDVIVGPGRRMPTSSRLPPSRGPKDGYCKL